MYAAVDILVIMYVTQFAFLMNAQFVDSWAGQIWLGWIKLVESKSNLLIPGNGKPYRFVGPVNWESFHFA